MKRRRLEEKQVLKGRGKSKDDNCYFSERQEKERERERLGATVSVKNGNSHDENINGFELLRGQFDSKYTVSDLPNLLEIQSIEILEQVSKIQV